MYIYFIVLLYWLLLFVFAKDNKSNRTLFFAIAPLFLVMALKSVSVGSDTISYYNRYIGADYMLTAENAITEPGYNLLSYFFHDIIGIPFYAYNAILSAFICFILALFIKHFSPNIYLSLFLYMTIGLFTMSMSGLRQMLAISFCTIPVILARREEKKGVVRRKKKIFIFLVGLACVFVAYSMHNSSIVFIPILFLMDIRLTKSQTIIIMILAIFTLLVRRLLVGVMSLFLFNRYEQYDINAGYMMNTLMLFIPIVIGMFCAVASRPDSGEQTYSKTISLMFVFMALYIMFNNLALSHNQIARLGYYFMNAAIILIPYSLNKQSKEIRSIVTPLIILLCLVFFYLGTNEGTLKIDDYKFFWQEPVYLIN